MPIQRAGGTGRNAGERDRRTLTSMRADLGAKQAALERAEQTNFQDLRWKCHDMKSYLSIL